MALVYATPGSSPSAGGIGWFNFGGGFTLNPGQTFTGLTGTFKDGSTVTFDISNTAVALGGKSFVATQPPTTSNSAFGNTGYTGIIGNVVLYEPTATTPGSETDVRISNIVVLDPNGNPFINYEVILADGETTNDGEEIVYATNGGGWNLLIDLPPVLGGVPVSPITTGIGTTVVTETGVGTALQPTSAPVIYSTNPTNLSVEVVSSETVSNSRQGFAIGFAINKVTLIKDIVQRINPADQFQLTISGTPSNTVNTTGNATGIQPVTANVFGIIGNTYTVNEAMAPGSVSSLSDYEQIVSAVNLAAGQTVPPVGSLPQSVALVLGDIIEYTVTNTPIQTEVLADISVVKIATPNPVTPGGLLTYTIIVLNSGPDDAENVILTDSIPSSIIGPEFSTNGGINFTPWPGFFNIGTLTTGNTRTIIIRGTVSPSASGVITNTANVISTTPDPNPLNNTFTVNTQVTGTQAGADISVIKTTNTNPVTQGEMLTYTLVVSNAGPAQAENVVLTDNVSPNIIGAEFSVDLGVTFNPWPGSINIGALPAGSTRTILIRGTVSSLAKGGIANAASVTSTTPDPNLLNNTSAICVEVKKVADVVVKKKCSICEKNLRPIVIFKIKVSNLGPSTAENVILEYKIPNGIFDVKFSIQGTTVREPWTGSFNIGDLEAGKSIIVILEGILRTNSKKKICNTARVTSTTFDPDLTNNKSSVCIKAMRYNNHRGCCEGFECFECNECEEFMEDRNCNWIRDDFY